MFGHPKRQNSWIGQVASNLQRDLPPGLLPFSQVHISCSPVESVQLPQWESMWSEGAKSTVACRVVYARFPGYLEWIRPACGWYLT
jgi:hypothetical protein